VILPPMNADGAMMTLGSADSAMTMIGVSAKKNLSDKQKRLPQRGYQVDN